MVAKKPKKDSLRQLDDLFLNILGSLIGDITREAGTSAEKVLELSGGFLSEKAQKAVTQFHQLYFGSAAVEKAKADVNADVDRLFDAIQNEVAKGANNDAIGQKVAENKDMKEARLRLSGVQKELETLIRLDAGIREKLTPVLTCMQFEDMVRQRLEHVLIAWQAIVEGMGADGVLDVELLQVEIDANLSSTDERADFYRIVMKKAPPADDLDSGSIWLEIA